MKPLKVAFLWHMHQPNYELNNKYLLPWARLHAIKDYLDFPSLLYKFPNVKFNFNYVPVLLDQLENITSGKIEDVALILSRINPSDLTSIQKNEIIQNFFTANVENMIKPYPRYNYLFNKSKQNENFSNQEILDLQVWYNLCWTGVVSKNNPLFSRLIEKQSGFSLQEKDVLLRTQIDLIKQIIPNLKNLIALGQIELSFSPYNHPILPLLADINSAKDALQELDLKDLSFRYPEDAESQVKLANKKYNELLNQNQSGIWPSEGSISNEILEIMIDNKINWTATDEEMLKNSDNSYTEVDKYFSRKFIAKNGEITLFFRDHKLSDKIGFNYTNWNPEDAVNDFFFDLHSIRNSIIDKYGEFALDHASVNIILDGENCWEFYNNLGLDFRNKLMERLNDDEYFSSVTLNEAQKGNSFLQPLKSIQAGSWINANFKIWIGEEIHRKAWALLAEIRSSIETKKSELSTQDYKNSLSYIYKAESSDWFWWYFSEHWAPNKADFDVLFRYNLKMALIAANLEIPNKLTNPVWSKADLEKMKHITGRAQTMHQVSF